MSVQERGMPAANYSSVEQPHLEQPARKCCKIRYRVRYFYSKGACLVLLCTVLISINVVPCWITLFISFKEIINEHYRYYGLFLFAPIAVCIPLAGWLADAKFGNYNVFRVGLVSTFVATLASNISSLLTTCSQISPKGLLAVTIASNFLGMIGATICLLIGLQLGLDQMPDASADNITSFIAWFVAACFGGIWGYIFLDNTLEDCVQLDELSEALIPLLPAVCMAIACCSLFIFAPSYLVVEPKVPKALRTIYQVLKFAAKHKAPLNRSALTYWEEDIPSRLDLGKSRFGGPFTTEQVENVKTFFKILLTCVPIFIIGFVASLDINVEQPSLVNCTSKLWVTYASNSWWGVTPLYEFALFPLIRNKLPNILRRIGLVSFLIFITKCSYLAISLADSQSTNDSDTSSSILLYPIHHEFLANMVVNFVNGLDTMFLVTGALEFVCAQSPYNMRGLLTGYTILLMLFSLVLLITINNLISERYVIARDSVLTAVSLIGLIFHCLLARWYKRRVRDEDYPTQRVVEEVYDRYLSHYPIINN